MESRHLCLTKTFWFHVSSVLVALAGVGLVYVNMLELTKEHAMYVSMAFITIQTSGGIYLRSITSKPTK